MGPKTRARGAQRRIGAIFERHGVRLTLGGEPTYVPTEPEGPEWAYTAVGPTKLAYAHRLRAELLESVLPGAISVLSPGKFYPGEAIPRWALHLLWNRDGSALAAVPQRLDDDPVRRRGLDAFRRGLARRLGRRETWLRGRDPQAPERPIWVLPLDHDEDAWVSTDWGPWLGEEVELLPAEGPAGLRLPLAELPESVSRRALALELRDGTLHVFFPPVLQAPFLELLAAVFAELEARGTGRYELEGYLPPDEQERWQRLSLTSDPGVLEVNLPACESWQEYERWLTTLERSTRRIGLRSCKQRPDRRLGGTGGGNHILVGGPSLEENPFFERPGWVASICRYWQRHPSLAYLFTGDYVGPSSQAPRPDETGRSLLDLELAYAQLERLPEGDHRQFIQEALRHLHTDAAGNVHRSEICFDKFWDTSAPGGCLGLIEFRAVESLPSARWMAGVALLWQALLAYLFEKPCRRRLLDFGDRLHDRYFLPSFLWADFEEVLSDLQGAGFELDRKVYRAIWDWRFPELLAADLPGDRLVVRRAHEGWPLLAETPIVGGATSRFVDTSMERLEITVAPEAVAGRELRIQGRPLPLRRLPGGVLGAGVRYRRSRLYPFLHPGIERHLPLELGLWKEGGRRPRRLFRLEEGAAGFEERPPAEAVHPPGPPARSGRRGGLCVDLRL